MKPIPPDETASAVAVSVEENGKQRALSPHIVSEQSGFARKALFGVLQFVVMAAVLAGGIFGMNRLKESRAERPSRPAQETVYTIQTHTAKAEANQPEFSVFGTIVSGRDISLGALVAGEVVEVNPDLKVGAEVKKQGLLLRIDRFDYDNAIAEADASYQEAVAGLQELRARAKQDRDGLVRAREQLELAEADFNRANALLESGTITDQAIEARKLIVSQRRSSVENLENALLVSEAQIEAREASIKRLEVQLKRAKENAAKTELRAPFTGIVRSSDVEVGQSVGVGGSLVSLYDPNALEVEFTLSNTQYGRIIASEDGVIGRDVEIIWRAGSQSQSFPANIARVAPVINAARGGITVFARFALDASHVPLLRVGAFVDVKVPDQQIENSFRLPETSLYEGNLVYVRNGDRLEARSVNLETYDGSFVLVTGGLQDGDKVLTTRIAEVGEGLKVIEEGETPAKPSAKREGGKGEGAASSGKKDG